jgi:hypothetical protein
MRRVRQVGEEYLEVLLQSACLPVLWADDGLRRSQRPNRRLVHENGGYYLYALIQ